MARASMVMIIGSQYHSRVSLLIKFAMNCTVNFPMSSIDQNDYLT
jgi:hypothetical protein